MARELVCLVLPRERGQPLGGLVFIVACQHLHGNQNQCEKDHSHGCEEGGFGCK